MDALRQSCHPVGEFQLVFPLRRGHGAGLPACAGPHTPRHKLAAAAAKPMFAPAPLEFTLRSAPHPQDGADTCSF